MELDQLCEAIMKLVRDMANDKDIESLVCTSLATAYEAGYIAAANELETEP